MLRDRLEDFKEDYTNNMPIDDLMEKYGFTRHYIYLFAHRNGFKRTKFTRVSKKVFTTEDKAEIVKYYNQKEIGYIETIKKFKLNGTILKAILDEARANGVAVIPKENTKARETIDNYKEQILKDRDNGASYYDLEEKYFYCSAYIMKKIGEWREQK